jgi:hypothetical protein
MRLLLVLLVFKTSMAFSQNENIILSQPEMNTFYKGFSQIISIGFRHKKIKKLKVICVKCDTIHYLKDNYYLVKPGQNDSITLEVFSKNDQILYSQKYKTRNLPIPTLKIDNFQPLDTISALPSLLSLENSIDPNIRVGFVIMEWKTTINGRNFNGLGSKFSKEFTEFLEKQKKGMFMIEINYRGPDKISKTIKELFFFNL